MRVRTYFIVFTVLLALNLLLGQCPSGLPEPWDSWLRWAAGVLSLVCLVLFYRKVMKPFRLIETGMTLLKEQDFGSRLHPVGQHDADRIVHLFNRMMEQLKRELKHHHGEGPVLDICPPSVPFSEFVAQQQLLIISYNCWLNVTRNRSALINTFPSFMVVRPALSGPHEEPDPDDDTVVVG